MSVLAIVAHLGLLLALPPLLPGVIAKTKAGFAGRRGAPLLQPYYDIARALRKGAVYSDTTGPIFRAGPLVALATALTAGLIVPLATATSPLGFEGDAIALAYVFGLGRFFTMAAALDTGSSFEGMGASREAAFAALAEPALFLSLVILCVPAGTTSLSAALVALPWDAWGTAHPEMLAAVIAVFVVLLAECSRIPVDDPDTHLELTMVHEVMVLDHGGPDFAFISYAAAVKLAVLGALLVHMIVPIRPEPAWQGALLFIGAELSLAVAVGVVESTMARLRVRRVPQFILAATAIAAVGVIVLVQGVHP